MNKYKVELNRIDTDNIIYAFIFADNAAEAGIIVHKLFFPTFNVIGYEISN